MRTTNEQAKWERVDAWDFVNRYVSKADNSNTLEALMVVCTKEYFGKYGLPIVEGAILSQIDRLEKKFDWPKSY